MRTIKIGLRRFSRRFKRPNGWVFTFTNPFCFNTELIKHAQWKRAEWAGMKAFELGSPIGGFNNPWYRAFTVHVGMMGDAGKWFYWESGWRKAQMLAQNN